MRTTICKEQAAKLIGPKVAKKLNNWAPDKIKLLAPPKTLADDTTKLLLTDHNERPLAVMICGITEFTNLAFRNTERANQVREKLHGDEKLVVLEPLDFGYTDDINYAVWPYVKPLSNHTPFFQIQKIAMRGKILPWLRNATQQTIETPSSEELYTSFISPLTKLTAEPELDSIVKSKIENILKRIESENWKPLFSLAHNDLWIGNVLNATNNKYRISVIDWAGAQVKGKSIFDLVKICMDLKVTGKKYSSEISQTCKILDCSIEDADSYLLSSMATLFQNLEHFPKDRYFALLKRLYNFHCANKAG